MSNITRTVYGARIQTELLLGLPHTAVANTTLNEKFDVQAGVMPANNVVPTLGYFGIGFGGHRNLVGPDSAAYTNPIQHSPADAALYRHLPFLLRELGNDLTPSERARYAMRRVVQINGVNRIGYYLRRIPKNGVVPNMQHNVPGPGGVITPSPFVPTGANLNPVAPPIPPVGSVSTDGSYLSTSATLNLSFTEADVAELLNVARLLFDNENRAIISEFALVAGVDQVVTSSSGSGSVSYLEAIQATVVAHVTAYYAMAFMTKGLDHALEVGAIEPLMVTSVP